MQTIQQIADENKLDQFTAIAMIKGAIRRGIEPDTQEWRDLLVEMPRKATPSTPDRRDRVISISTNPAIINAALKTEKKHLQKAKAELRAAMRRGEIVNVAKSAQA